MAEPQDYDENGRPVAPSAAAVTPGVAAEAGAAAVSPVNSASGTSMLAALQRAREVLAKRSAPASPQTDLFAETKKILADKVTPPAYLQGGPLLDDLAIKDAAIKGALPPEALRATHEAEFRGVNHPAPLTPRPSPFPGPPMLAPGEDPRTGTAPPIVPAVPDYSYLESAEIPKTPLEIQRKGYLDTAVSGSASGLLTGPDGVTIPMPSDPAGLARLGTTKRLALIQQLQSGNVTDSAAANQALLEWKDQDARIRQRFGLPPGINILLPHGKAPGIDIGPIREALFVAETMKDRSRGIPIDNKDIGDRVAAIIRAEVTSAGGTLHGIPTYEIDRSDAGAEALAWVHQAKRRVGEALLGEKGSDGAVVSALKDVGFSDDLSRDFGRGIVSRLMYPLEAAAFTFAHTKQVSVARNLGTLDERELAGEGGIGFIARVIDPVTPMIAARAFGAELSDPDYLVFVRRGGGVINAIPEIADLAARQSLAERAVREGMAGVGIDTTTPNDDPWYTQVPALAANAAAGLLFRSSYTTVTGVAEIAAETAGLALGSDPQTNLFELRPQEEYPAFFKNAIGAGATLGAIFVTPDVLSAVAAPVFARTYTGVTSALNARKRAKGLPVGALEESLFASKAKIDSLPDDAPPEEIHRVVSELSRDPIFGVVFGRHYTADLAKRTEEITGRPPDMSKEPGAAVRSAERTLRESATNARDAALAALGKTREELAAAIAGAWRAVPTALEPRVSNSEALRLPDGTLLRGEELQTAREFAAMAGETGVPLDRLVGGRLKIARRLGVDPMNKTAREVAEEVAEVLSRGKVEIPRATTVDDLAKFQKALSDEGALREIASARNWSGSTDELRTAVKAELVRAAGFNVPQTIAESREAIYGAVRFLLPNSDQAEFVQKLMDAPGKAEWKRIFKAAPPDLRQVIRDPEIRRLLEDMDRLRADAPVFAAKVNRARRLQEIMEARKQKKALKEARERGESAKTQLDPDLPLRGIGTSRPNALEDALAAQRAAGGALPVPPTNPVEIERARGMVEGTEKFGAESPDVNAAEPSAVQGTGEALRRLDVVQQQLRQYEEILRGTEVLATELRAAAGAMPKDLQVSDLPAKWREAADEALQTSAEFSLAISEVEDVIRVALDDVKKFGNPGALPAVEAVVDALAATRQGQDVPTKVFVELLADARKAIREGSVARVAAAQRAVDEAEALVLAARTSKKEVMEIIPRVSEEIDVATRNLSEIDGIYAETLAGLVKDGIKRADAKDALSALTSARNREAARLRALLAFRETAARAIALTDPKAAKSAVDTLTRTARTNDDIKELVAGLLVARNAAEQALGVAKEELKVVKAVAQSTQDDGARILSALASSRGRLTKTREAARAPLRRLQKYRDLYDAARVEAVRDQAREAIKPLRAELAELAKIGPPEMQRIARLMAREFAEVEKLRRMSRALASLEGGKARLMEVYQQAAEQLPRVQKMLQEQPWRGVKNPLSRSMTSSGGIDPVKFRQELLNGGVPGWVIRQFMETHPGAFPLLEELLNPDNTSVLATRAESSGNIMEDTSVFHDLAGSSLEDFLAEVRKRTPPGPKKALLELAVLRINDLSEFGVKIDLDWMDPPAKGYVKTVQGAVYVAHGNVGGGAILGAPTRMTLSLWKDHVSSEVVLHELIHMATILQLAYGPKAGFAKEIVDLQKSFVSWFNKLPRNVVENDPMLNAIFTRSTNTAVNPDEFVAWGLTNAKFQKTLAGIRTADGATTPATSIFQSFVHAVARALGVPESSDTLLAETIASGAGLMTEDLEKYVDAANAKGFKFGSLGKEGELPGWILRLAGDGEVVWTDTTKSFGLVRAKSVLGTEIFLLAFKTPDNVGRISRVDVDTFNGAVPRETLDAAREAARVLRNRTAQAVAQRRVSDADLSELGRGLDALNLFNKEVSAADPRNVLATAALLNMDDVYAPVSGGLFARFRAGLRRFVQINIRGDADLANFGQFRGVYYSAVRSTVAATELGMEDIGSLQASHGENYPTVLRQYLTSTTPIETKVGGDWGALTAPGGVRTLGNRGEIALWDKAVTFIRGNLEVAKELGLVDGLARSHIPDDYWGNVPEDALFRLRAAAEESLEKSPSLSDFEEDMARAVKLVFDGRTVSRTVRADTFMAVNVIQAAAMNDFSTDVWRIQTGTLAPEVAKDINKIISLQRSGGERGSNALQAVEDFEAGLQGLNRWGKSMITGKIAGFDAGAGMRAQEKLISAVTITAMADERKVAVVPMHLLREAVASLDSVIKEGGQFAIAPLPSFSPFGKNLTRFIRMGLLHGIFMRNQRYFGNIFFGDFSAMLATVSPEVATNVAWASAPSMIPWVGPAIQKALGLLRAGKPLPSMSLGVSNRTLARMLDGESFYITFGTRTYHTSELIEMMKRGGVLETAVSADVISGAGAAAEAINGGRQGASLGTIAAKRLEDWTESIALMAHEQQRRTRALLFLELLNQGEEGNHAAKLVREALFDWKHGLVRSELNGPIAKMSMFYRYHRLKSNWIVNKLLDASVSPDFGAGLTSQSQLARVVRSTQVTTAVPRLAAHLGGVQDEDTREYDQWLAYAHPEWMNGRYAMSAPMERTQRQYMKDRGYGIADTTAWAIPSSTALDAAQLVINMMGATIFSAKSLGEYASGDPRAHASFTFALNSLIAAVTSVVTHPYMDFVLNAETFDRDWPLKPAETEMFSRLPIIKDMIGRREDGVPVLPGFMVAVWQLLGRSMFLSGPLDVGNAFLASGGQPAFESATEILFNVSGLGRSYYVNAEANLTKRSQATAAGLHAAVERARAQARGAPPR